MSSEAKKFKVLHIRSGKTETVAQEQWDQIVANGNDTEFRIVEEQPVPAEVAAKLQADKPK